jgi:two-component system, cell cycle response regulator
VSDEFDDQGERTAIVDRAALLSMIPKSRQHVLVRMDGSAVGQVLALSKDTWTVGRLPESDIHLTSEGISRRHARLVKQGDQFHLEDLASANGTFVGGVKVTQHALRDGDVIQFGPRAVFRYSVADAHEERMLRHLYEASVRDALTGAYNREYLNERLKTEVGYARRHKTILSLVLIDLDHFKAVNDTYGHQAGDAALVQLSAQLVHVLRAEDVFARYGGEEFAVTLRGIALDGAERVGQRLRHAVTASPVRYEDHVIHCTISAGAASLDDCPDPTPEQLIAVADRRLYIAKRTGRNRVVASG